MSVLIAFLLIVFFGSSAHASSIPSEWQAAAQAVESELEHETPLAAKPWTHELTCALLRNSARAWRRHNNGNVEITFRRVPDVRRGYVSGLRR